MTATLGLPPLGQKSQFGIVEIDSKSRNKFYNAVTFDRHVIKGLWSTSYIKRLVRGKLVEIESQRDKKVKRVQKSQNKHR